MPDYQKMYYILCAASSKAIDAVDFETAQQILQTALHEAEDLYIDTAEDGLAVIENAQRECVHDLVDRLLGVFPTDKVYSAVFQLWDGLKSDI